MSDAAIELIDLTHSYGRKAVALDHLNLSMPAGKIYGLLGRNGAGKSTLINILIAGLKQTSGTALIFGEAPYENPKALGRLCVVREKGMFPATLTVKQALLTCKDLYINWDHDYALQLLNAFSLNPKKRYKQLSRGMESSLGLIIGLASRSELTIFDEPSLGLDAVARETFYSELRKDIDAHPRTIVISTHLIDEVARIFDEVVIIDKGRKLAQSTVEALTSTAVQVSGDESLVAPLIAGCELLHEERLSNMYAASVRLKEGQTIDPPEGAKVESLPLQRLFVYLTEGRASE